MRIAVLGATGPTGRQLVTQALDRGHEVVALARSPSKLDDIARPQLTVAQADVRDGGAVQVALDGVDALVSGLGVAKGETPGVLAAGAQAVAGAHVPRVIWLGALGTGGSSAFAGPLWPQLLRRVLAKEIPDKEQADAIILAAGGASVHAPILKNGAISATATVAPAGPASRRTLPGTITRASVAKLMIDLAEAADLHGGVYVARS